MSPNDINGVRTDLIMKRINEKVYNNNLLPGKFELMSEIIYKSLTDISIINLSTLLKQTELRLFDNTKETAK